jgi:predicted O-methyltransferase YrrM
MAVRYTPESARRLTRKDRAHRAQRWALVGGIAVVLVGGSAGLVDPVAGVIAAVATAVVLISATLGRDLAIVRADLSEQRALLALASLREGLVYPLNPAALCPENALFVIQQIYQRRPQRVVEFGSGVSTILFARALRDLGEKRQLDSFEHLESWYQRTRELLRSSGLEDVVRLHYSPLEKRDGLEVPWYDVSVLDRDATPCDLVVVDGPEGGSREPLARIGGFLTLRDRLAPDAVVLLDDAFRRGEREIVRAWQRAEPRLRTSLHRSDTGMWMLELSDRSA